MQMSANAQIGVGGIEGKIMGNIEPVSAAEVVLMQKDQLIDKTVTDEHGHYAFYYINPGCYDVRATKADYRTSIIITIPVSQDHTTYNDLYLPKFNNEHMPNDPIVESYDDNFRKYMMHRKSFHPKEK